MGKSFKVKLALFLGAVVLVSSVVIGASLTMLSADRLGNMRNETSENLADEVTLSVGNYLKSFTYAIDLVSNDSNVHSTPSYNPSAPWMLKTFDNVTTSYPDIGFIYVGYDKKNAFRDPEMRNYLLEFYGNKPGDDKPLMVDEALYNTTKGFFTYPHFHAKGDYDPHQRGWFLAAKDTKDPIWTEVYIDAFTGLPVITCAKSIYTPEGKYLGVVGADISLNNISDAYKDKVIGNTGYLFITDAAGNVITHPDSTQWGKNISEAAFWPGLAEKTTGYVTYEHEGIEKFLYFNTIEETGWKIAVPFESHELNADTQPLKYTGFGLTALVVLLGLLIGFTIASRITKDLNQVNSILAKVADGDLTEKIQIRSQDEIGQMGDSLNHTIDTLNTLMVEINNTSDTVRNNADSLTKTIEETTLATNEIARSIQEVAEGSSSQAEEVNNGTERMSSIDQKINVVNDLSNDMALLSDEVKEESEKGIDTMRQLITKVNEKEESSKNLSVIISSVDDQSKKIGEITDTISSIADQTNLLALNASIESARAGEAGKGFAVVAEEIRKLAEQSADASEEIKQLINDMQNQSSQAVETVETNRTLDAEEFEAVKETEAIFNLIFDSLNKLVDSIDQIKKQNNVVTDDSRSLIDVMNNVSAVTEESSASAEQVSAATEEQLASMEDVNSRTNSLKEAVEHLHEQISRFKTL